MKKSFNPELARAINQKAHILAAQSFASIRMTLQEKARALLRQGKSRDETLQAIRTAGMHRDAQKP